MRKSRIKAKLRLNQPVLLTTLHLAEPTVFEMTSLMGFDGIWMDLEHHQFSVETANTMVRAARVGTTDVMIRAAKWEYMRIGRLLELGAQGIMYPRCSDANEAREVVRWSKFAPLGQRGFDGGNPDNPYCMMPTVDYIQAANDETFVVIQIEDQGALSCVREIAAVKGVDVLFFGPSDFSILSGIPAQFGHELITNAMREIAAAAKAAGIHWGMPIFSLEHAQQVLDLGGRFLAHGCDMIMVQNGLKDIQRKFAPLGCTFETRT